MKNNLFARFAFIALSLFVVLFSIAILNPVYAQPSGWHYPPCKADEALDTYCESYLTNPTTGEKICAPGKMVDICVPVGTADDLNNKSNVQRCIKDGVACVDTTASKQINGYPVSLAEVGGCWEYRRDFTCSTDNVVDTCGDLRNDSNCSVWSRTCQGSDTLFGCTEWEMEYRCITKPGRTEQIEFCGDTEICIGGVCWDTSYLPDEDFAQAITDMEAARQMAVYAPKGLDIFGGDSAVCRSKRAAGLKNCCKKDTSAKTNNAVMGEFISGATGYAVRAGSKFMFDTLYGETLNWVSSGWSAAITGNLPGGQSLIDSIANPGFGMYGLSIGGTGTFLGTSGIALMNTPPVYFNPYSFAFAIAMHVIMEAMTCSEDEAWLALKRGANLCSSRIGSWCSKKILGVCITRKQSYCCYNSKLAKIINVQGRQQLGKGWGDEESPSCGGFTANELERIDFSRIDFSEFVGDVMSAVDVTHLTGDKSKAQNAEFADSALEKACEQTYNAVGGDLSLVPSECQKYF